MASVLAILKNLQKSIFLNINTLCNDSGAIIQLWSSIEKIYSGTQSYIYPNLLKPK